MEVHEALSQISEIRTQIARTETFRGYRSVTVASTGILAVLVAAVQGIWIPNPTHQLTAYVTLWMGAALVALGMTAFEMHVRSRHASSSARRLTTLAIEQFVPCLAAGGALTALIVFCARDVAWMLPGLWSMLFSLGVFASWRLLSRPIFWVAVFYLLAGVLCLGLARAETALSPWCMAGSFGVGQFLAAGILYFTLERNYERV